MQNHKLSYYINAAKSLETKTYEKKIKVALLSSFTINGLEETLKVKCSEINVNCLTYVGDYNQYNQNIIDSNSKLYKFLPDVSFLILDSRSIFGKLYHNPYSLSESKRKEYVNNKFEELANILNLFTNNSKSKLIVTNFVVPVYSPYGIYETKANYGLQDMVKDLNSKLIDYSKTRDAVYVYDFNGFVTRYGQNNIFDYRQYFFGDVQISVDYIPYFAADLLGYIKTILGLNKKCIVLDLDNTLWGGIVGEDGFDGIRLGQDPIGKAYLEFQKQLLALYERGIILAINSKNNPDEALRVIKEHPYMILRANNFACIKINWEDKVKNMKEIAQELNIGLDSIAYFDDDAVNREYMQMNLPQVLTVDLPSDVTYYAKTLTEMNDFHILKLTTEDLSRNKMYIQEKQRKELESSIVNLDDFLKQLDIKVTIKKSNDFTIPRISQLTLKTNQFNLTTRRYQEEDVKNFTKSDNYWVGCAQVEDKFGDSGITGVFIVRKENKSEWLIDTFLLSCRIMGRKIEDCMLSVILQKAKDSGVEKVKGEFIPTAKNKPCENFFSDYGFIKEGNYWVFTLNKPIKTPRHITCNIE